jgi:hypothetical protein
MINKKANIIVFIEYIYGFKKLNPTMKIPVSY